MGKPGFGRSICSALFLKKKLKITMTSLRRESMQAGIKLVAWFQKNVLFQKYHHACYSGIASKVIQNRSYFQYMTMNKKAEPILGLGFDASLFTLGEPLTSFSFGGFKTSLLDVMLRIQRLLSSDCLSGSFTHASLGVMVFSTSAIGFSLTSTINILPHLWTARLILYKPLPIWRKN